MYPPCKPRSGSPAFGVIVTWKEADPPAGTDTLGALNATVDGQTTAHVIAEYLEGSDVSVTSLAKGVPVGGELDYLDEGTISAALAARKAL